MGTQEHRLQILYTILTEGTGPLLMVHLFPLPVLSASQCEPCAAGPKSQAMRGPSKLSAGAHNPSSSGTCPL